MRKLTLATLIVGIVGSGASGLDAAYVIKLKNGNEYVTTRYWQEGRQVLFDTYGGTFGVARAFVTRIEKADTVLRITGAGEQGPLGTSQAEAAKPDKDEAKPAAEVNSAKRRDPDDRIAGQFDRLKKRSTEVNGLLTSEIRDLLREITAFKNKLSKDSKLFIEYAREFNDAHEIGSTVESALRARTQ